MPTVVITRKHLETATVCVLELAESRGDTLPPFTAGAHIDVHLGEHGIRQYSLCNAPTERYRYVIAIRREPSSQGGAGWLHERLQCGDTLTIGTPRNLFALHPGPARHLLVAAGIGITPMLSMAHALKQRGEEFELHYRIRSTAEAAFLPYLQEHFAGNVRLYADPGSFARAALPGAASGDKHLYVCGPARFMTQVIASARAQDWPVSNIHREYFSGAALVDEPSSLVASGQFEVQIASSGAIYPVPTHQSVHAVLEANGIEVPISCGKGICGACLTGVLSGAVDHRDQVLSEEEQARNDLFTPCCSRATSARLVLDL